MASLRPENLVLRCYGYRKKDGTWYGLCLDLNIAAEAGNRDELVKKIGDMIKSYLVTVFDTDDKGSIPHLLKRKAPISDWLHYYILKLILYIKNHINAKITTTRLEVFQMITDKMGVELLMTLNEVKHIFNDAEEAFFTWNNLSDTDKERVVNACKKLAVNKKNEVGVMRCAIQVNVDSRGPMWINGIIIKKFRRNPKTEISTYVVDADDHLYYVTEEHVYINAMDLKGELNNLLLNNLL